MKTALIAAGLGLVSLASAQIESAEEIAAIAPDVFAKSDRESLSEMVRLDIRRRLSEANTRSSAGWSGIDSRASWEAFAKPKIAALEKSLGQFPEPPDELIVIHAGEEITGNGFIIRKLAIQSRPGLCITANLYLPIKRAQSMPGILLCHSHHRPKEHGELQDMGMTWARAGCVVLVPDHLGHGERRQHPFASSEDFNGEFAVSRQDYYFRYDAGIQLHLVGDSLTGWMVWDLRRCVDALIWEASADPEKIILLGAVAGGGDPAAITAAVDQRIAAAVPFNFGGPQPETRFPLPDDVETTFNYAGSGGWESTRNLRGSAAAGFLPWVIVGGIAPRRLVFAHEFSWDQPRDPVWKRLQTIYGFYAAPRSLASTHGRGEVRGKPPEATHCTHIGRFHRERIHEAFGEWFDIDVKPENEFSDRIDSDRLHCLPLKSGGEFKRLVDLLPEMADERLRQARSQFLGQSPPERRRYLRERLPEVLGNVDPVENSSIEERVESAQIVRLILNCEHAIRIPTILLKPAAAAESPPVVVAVAQGGKAAFLRERSGEIASLLARGIAVCLPDLRGIGETRAGADRGRYAADTGLSSSELMLGGTMVGARLRDLRTVVAHLRSRRDVDGARIAIWGDSFASTNDADTRIEMPRRIDGRPAQSEPLGGMLGLLVGIFEEDITAIRVSGGLHDFRSVLESQFTLIPHDVVIPGLLTVTDLPDLAEAIEPDRLQLSGAVDARNRRLIAAPRRFEASWFADRF